MKARISWISPKGYGFARLSDGREAYVPANVLSQVNHHKEAEFNITLATGHASDRLVCQAMYPAFTDEFGENIDD